MTQGLLTLGAIPAISVDTPHYPEEREREEGGGLRFRGGAAHTSGSFTHAINLQKRAAAACEEVKGGLSL